MRDEILQSLNLELAQGRDAVLVTILKTRGSTPRKAGAQMLVLKSGRLVGTIGGGQGECLAVARAGQAFAEKASSVHRLSMNNSVAALEGMACGGDMEVFVQYVAPLDEESLL